MNNLQLFSNPEFGEVRMVEIDGKPYAVGKDVAEALGYSNTKDAISRHCKGVVKHDLGVQTGTKRDGSPSMQIVSVAVIPEGDLYRLIVHSKLPAAEKFERWVFDEVLPSIRQTGGYMIPKTKAEALRLAADLEEQNERLQQKIQQQKPQVLLAEAVTASDNCISVNELAKILKQNGVNTGRNRLFDWLRNNGYLIKSYGDEYNLPTQRSMDMGLFEIDSCPIIQHGEIITKRTTKVTRKGQAYFIQKLCYETA